MINLGPPSDREEGMLWCWLQQELEYYISAICLSQLEANKLVLGGLDMTLFTPVQACQQRILKLRLIEGKLPEKTYPLPNSRSICCFNWVDSTCIYSHVIVLWKYVYTVHKEQEIQYRMRIQKYSTYCVRRKLVQLVELNSLKLSERGGGGVRHQSLCHC